REVGEIEKCCGRAIGDRPYEWIGTFYGFVGGAVENVGALTERPCREMLRIRREVRRIRKIVLPGVVPAQRIRVPMIAGGNHTMM
ncbi:MAG: hypothetical protein J6V25_07675, partial [Oscillospiraceae bacterium]|nr:hypothetical protein [Oscillospiraceae bacterium]